jgi:hypothetical protein
MFSFFSTILSGTFNQLFKTEKKVSAVGDRVAFALRYTALLRPALDALSFADSAAALELATVSDALRAIGLFIRWLIQLNESPPRRPPAAASGSSRRAAAAPKPTEAEQEDDYIYACFTVSRTLEHASYFVFMCMG